MSRPVRISELVPIVMEQIENRHIIFRRELARWFAMTDQEKKDFEQRYGTRINPLLGIPEDEVPF